MTNDPAGVPHRDLSREPDTRDDDLMSGMIPDAVDGSDDRPLDPDVDDDQLDSAAADERAATDGTLDSDSAP